MAEPASTIRELALAALGAVSLSAERVDRLADDLSELGGLRRDEARSAIEELASRWRGDAVRISEKTRQGLDGIFRELGLVTEGQLEELELRVAQLEHRLRLLESPSPPIRPSR